MSSTNETLLDASSRRFGSNQDERLPPPGPEHLQGNPEQLVQDSQSTARSLRVQSQQLLMESQVLKDELLMGAESAEQPAEQMSERHDHVKNLTETSRSQLCAKSFILQVYDVLARHSPGQRVLPGGGTRGRQDIFPGGDGHSLQCD